MTTIPRIGHNNGPTMEAGGTWRTTAWSKARSSLMPNLPIEVLRTRVARAKEIGLPYKTYASVRASTGRDVIGFLFSSNALRMLRDESLAPAEAEKLAAMVNCDRAALVHAPLDPARIVAPLDGGHRAPSPLASWSLTAQHLSDVLKKRGLVRDGTIIVGDTTLERDWCLAARAAAYLEADRFFTQN